MSHQEFFQTINEASSLLKNYINSSDSNYTI